MDVCCECCVLSGRGLCDELLTRPEESYRLWCVVVCDLETSWMKRPWPIGGCHATNKQKDEINTSQIPLNFPWPIGSNRSDTTCSVLAVYLVYEIELRTGGMKELREGGLWILCLPQKSNEQMYNRLYIIMKESWIQLSSLFLSTLSYLTPFLLSAFICQWTSLMLAQYDQFAPKCCQYIVHIEGHFLDLANCSERRQACCRKE